MTKTITNNLSSTVVISVYTDAVALSLILASLAKQTIKNFEIIISEDGESKLINEIVKNLADYPLPIRHLSQPDSGFRKNIALNRAIHNANTEHLIFIDGDCVPHPGFVKAHQCHAKHGVANTGRRVELGEKISGLIRNGKISLTRLTNRLAYLFNLIPLISDNAKNIESGIYSTILRRLTQNREIRLLGCNFSCNKQDLIKINGFNEDYLAPGIGEDSDIDWRLTILGVKIKNVKFSAIQYHLYHPRAYSTSQENVNIFNKTKQENNYACTHGLTIIETQQTKP